MGALHKLLQGLVAQPVRPAEAGAGLGPAGLGGKIL